ncbi:MAG: mucoidy inhibitor MuiA family protein [Methyloligellaceae bacterium]
MYGRFFGALMMASALTCPSFVFADDIPAESSIAKVTVFPRGAQITRQLTVDVKSGEHTIFLKDLPAGAIHDSIRVEGAADGKLEIGSVDVKTVHIPRDESNSLKGDERKALEDELQRLTDQRAGLNGKLKALKFQQSYIEKLSRIPEQPVSISKHAENQTQPDWEKLFNLIGNSMQSLQSQKLQANIEVREVNKKIREVQKKLRARPPSPERRTQVQIIVNADKDLKAALKVRYQIRNASWRPFYDARLKTSQDPKQNKLLLTRRASISQASGEEWKDVELLLSTTKPNRSTAAPNLNALQVAIRPEPKPQKLTLYERRKRAAPVTSESDSVMAEAPAENKNILGMFSLAKERKAKTTVSSFQAVYSIPGKVSIETTGVAKKLTISKLSIEPELKAIIVPKMQKAAYLSAKFTLPEGDQLLSGRVSLHRDGVYIGSGYLPDMAAGAEHDLGFGADDAIQVKYAEVKRSKGESGIISSSKTDMRKFKISVKNLHGWSIPMTVLDQIPYSENEKIKVTLLSETTKPNRKDIDDKRGLLAWDFELKKGEEKKIDLAYQVGWPENKEVIYRNR